jgi:hypothetical protein
MPISELDRPFTTKLTEPKPKPYLEVFVHNLVARLPLDRPHTQDLAQVRLVQVIVDILRAPITGLEHEHFRIIIAWISDQKRLITFFWLCLSVHPLFRLSQSRW